MTIDLQCFFEILHRPFEKTLIGGQSTTSDQSVDTGRVSAQGFIEVKNGGTDPIIFHQSNAFGDAENERRRRIVSKVNGRALTFPSPILDLVSAVVYRSIRRLEFVFYADVDGVDETEKHAGDYRLKALISVMCRISLVLDRDAEDSEC